MALLKICSIPRSHLLFIFLIEFFFILGIVEVFCCVPTRIRGVGIEESLKLSNIFKIWHKSILEGCLCL